MPTLTRNGHALFYVEEGAGGSPPVLLIHGWCCDHTYLVPQLRHFARSRRVVAVDLLGHGRSDKPVQPYTMASFADDVAWMCGELRLAKPLIVGHSMGGIVSLEVAARHPSLPAALVVLDSVTIPTAERRAHLEELLAAYRAPDYLEAVRTSLPAFFSPYDDPALNARIMAEMSLVPQHVLAGAWEGLCRWDGVAAVSACKVPLLYVAASEARTDLPRLKQLCPHMLTAQVVGAGHFVQLDVPDQVNPMLDRFIEILAQVPVTAS